MKQISFALLMIWVLGLTSCKKVTDTAPESNLNTVTYYSNLAEAKAALNGCYNGMIAPLITEWQMTELRSDNSKQGQTGSTSQANRDLSDLDVFAAGPELPAIATYWQSTYANIRNINLLLQKLGVVYDPATGGISFNPITASIQETDRRQLAGEAMILRANHYFNLVRLYGGVMLVSKPISADEAKTINRSSADDIYKFIIADLTNAAANMSSLKYSQMVVQAPADLGRVTGWTAKALLAKVYLTLNRKPEAITLLQDVRTNSGYALQPVYANVFSVTNEVNSELLFVVRYKGSGVGLGSPFANLFGPLSSGSNVVQGDGQGLNTPTNEFDTTSNGDGRKATNMGTYSSGANLKLYVRKYTLPGTLPNDNDNDWPVLRFADVLLMLAEAQGYNQSSLDVINLVRARASMPLYTMSTITSVAQFEQALSNERRMEFAFENQRWFDLLRFNTTLTTITAEQTMKDHFAREYFNHYRLYSPPITLAQLQNAVTRNRLILPIPQREIDTNTSLGIPQNPGY